MKDNLFIRGLKWLASSFDNYSQGSSSRKLTAFAFMCCIIYLHLYFVTKESAYEFLLADMAVLLLIFGIIKMDDVIALRTGVKKEDPPKPDNQ